jgi:putative ABC transport system permease protein
MNAFDLERAIAEWRKELRRNPALEDGQAAELEACLRDEVEELVGKGTDPATAFCQAVAAMGPAAASGAEFYKAKRTRRSSRPPWQPPRFVPALAWNYIQVALRRVRRQRAYSFINIAGLAVGITCALLIWLWVQDELGFDRFHRDARAIFRVETRAPWDPGTVSIGTPYPLGPALAAELPDIADVSRVGRPGTLLVKAGEKSSYEFSLLAVDPAFLRLFNFPLERGDAGTALSQPLSVVISRDMADKYFPGQDPLGKTLTVNRDFALTVTGVMKNPPQNSSMRPHFLVPIDRMDDLRASRGYWANMDRWDLFAFNTWVRLRDRGAAAAVGEKIGALVKTKTDMPPQPWTLNPLVGMQLAQSRSQVALFSALALFVLLVACINFMNLATARAANRAKEIGMRKVVGACRRNIVAQFYGEAFLTVFLAVLGAALLFATLLPAFRQISGKEIGLDAALNWRFGLGFLAVFLLTGLLAGSYPAFLLSALQPVKTLRGQWRAGARAAAFRRALVVFQFALSAVLLVGTGVVSRQVDHVRTMDPGYEKDHLVYVNLRTDAAGTYPALKTELQGEPLVPAVTASFQPPMDNGMKETGTSWEGKDPEARTYVYYDDVDYDYPEALGLAFVAGRSFSPERPADLAGGFLVNERMVKLMGLRSPAEALGRQLSSWGETGPIVGVLKDYHFMSARNVIEPQVISLGRDKLRYAVFRLKSGRIQASLDRVRAAWSKVNPGHPFEYHFFDEAFDLMYRADERLGTMVKYFAGMGILVACLGLFGLAAFTAAQRTKEIGVRKVLGGSTPGLAVLLGKEFLVWVAFANLLAWPAAYLATSAWLKGFAYRASYGWWFFPLAAAVSLTAALATVGYQALRAALANPVDSLKYE